jgi:hypothetical protein
VEQALERAGFLAFGPNCLDASWILSNGVNVIANQSHCNNTSPSQRNTEPVVSGQRVLTLPWKQQSAGEKKAGHARF